MMKHCRHGIAIALAAVLAGCSNAGTEPVQDDRSSFSLIQTEIFAKSCAVSGCHAGPSPTGKMSLEADLAYDNLIDVVPSNEFAQDDGYRRVRPGVPDSSFLYRKVAGC